MLRFAFDDLPPIEIEGDAIFNAFCAAFVPLITASKQDRENGQKGGGFKTGVRNQEKKREVKRR